MKKIAGTTVVFLVLSMHAGFIGQAYTQEKKLVIHFFYGRECPHCKVLAPELRKLVSSDNRLELRSFEVWYNRENRALLMRMARERGEKARGVPTVIVGQDIYLGADIQRVRMLVKKNLGR